MEQWVMEVVTVRYQGEDAGALSFDTSKGYGSFQIYPQFY